MKIGLIDLVHEKEHHASGGHPEDALRMIAALDYVKESDISNKITLIDTEFPPSDIIFMVHAKVYLRYARELSQAGGGHIDGDTYLSAGSYDAAVKTASAAVTAANMIMNGKYNSIFIAGRPPGHHAEKDQGMGFCLINNAAVAAESLVLNHGLKRVAIIDWDVHHGNGTQRIFYERPDVFYISLHRYPFYPGTGSASEKGEGKGLDYTLNIALSGGSGDENYLSKFEEIIVPSLEKYEPEFIIISCGFDAHGDDPLGGMQLTETAFGDMTRILIDLSARYAKRRILSLFEGGYNPRANSYCLYKHLKELVENYE